MNDDIKLIKAQLQDRIGDLCRRLLPEGREEGGQWVAFNPVTGDARVRGRLPCLKVRMRGGVVGAWKDWRSGDAGDVIDLVAYVERTDRGGALTFARDFLGLRSMTREDRERMRRDTARRAEVAARQDVERRRRKLDGAQQLFLAPGGDKAVGPAALVPQGTFGFNEEKFRHAAQLHGEAYFAARGAPLAEIPTLNRASLRFSPATEWWKGAAWKLEDGRRIKTAAGPLYPAVHAAMRNGLGQVTACHVTFLDPARPAKAPVDTAKLMYGEALGAVIELSTGPAQKPFWLWEPGEAAHPVILTEGIETGLSFCVTGIAARVWACGSLAGIGGAPVHLDCVQWVMFARDNNTGNVQAQKQFAAAHERLEASGKDIVVESSHVGDDFNDLLKGDE